MILVCKLSQRSVACLRAGAALFGTGWGMYGVCPGPGLALVGAHPLAAGPLAFVGAMCGGMRLAGPAMKALRLA